MKGDEYNVGDLAIYVNESERISGTLLIIGKMTTFHGQDAYPCIIKHSLSTAFYYNAVKETLDYWFDTIPSRRSRSSATKYVSFKVKQ